MLTDPDLLNVRLFVRWYRLRQSHPHLVPALLQDPERGIYTFTNPMDPWGSRTRLPFAELERMVTEAELAAARIGVQSERMTERKEGAA